MAGAKQELGEFGEKLVVKLCVCPKCKKKRVFKRLPANFKCVDLICEFCGFLAQVKAKSVSNIDKIPMQIPGAAWEPQEERMKAFIFFPLYVVLVGALNRKHAVYYLSADLQYPEMFVARKRLSATAKRAGWQGFYYDLKDVKDAFVRLV